ncbi:MAG: alpha/beta hydrolase domain-containing protein [Acidimicrobiales bacterium]
MAKTRSHNPTVLKADTTAAAARMLLGLLVALLSVSLATQLGAGAWSAAQATTTPEVSYLAAATLIGPITTGHISEPLTALPLDLAKYGYVEQEFFASGTATAFKAGSMPSNGRWTITPTSTAPYKTRIIVRRPANPARFNGTVVVEWMNETAGESAPDWDLLNPMLMSDGYAYVAVAAQSLGVDGGTPLLGTGSGNTVGLVQSEPARYGSLHQPGDQYALDIFAQIGQALRAPRPAALGGLKPKHVVATGESQSAFYLTTFADALQPRTNTFDGIFIHSRGAGGASLKGIAINSSQVPKNLRIRTDLKVPVFMFETQTDLIGLGYAAAQQPNTDKIRTWEVAGTSHADAYILGSYDPSNLGCTTPINNGPQHEVVQAAFVAFDKWVVDGTTPPSPLPFRLARTDPPALALDKYGNVVGGVRTPAVDAPVSTLSGAAPAGTSAICSLFGSSTPFSQSHLVSLYGTKSGYLKAYKASLNKAITMRFILPADRASLLAQAQAVQIPS